MKTKKLILTGLSCLCSFTCLDAAYYVGGDISLLPTFEAAGSTYYTNSGEKIDDLITYCYDQGMNAMRVRLFVDPNTFISGLGNAENWQKRAIQDYDYILPLCQKIKKAGHKLLLDFHYSDTWADPSNQWTPASWTSLSESELCSKLKEYTIEILTNLKNNEAEPDFIQTGNEISYGMCWGAYKISNPSKSYISTNSNLTRFQNLLTSAIEGCRQVCPDAKIVLHTERVAQTSVLTGFYDWARSLDYDIIGLSYYFYYHGALTQLDTALKALETKNFGKKIWIVETGAPLRYTMNGTYDDLYGVTDSEQNRYTTEFLELLDNHSSVNGVFWWDMEYNPKGANLSKYPFISDWYNASLFDNNTGKATSSFETLASWAKIKNGSSSDDEDDNNDNQKYQDFYLIYNHGGGWTYPGTVFTNNNDGTYSLTDIEIFDQEGINGWFAISSVYGTSWGMVSASLYGPTNNNEDPTKMVSSKCENNQRSWQVAHNTYDLFFDSINMTLTVKISGTADLELMAANDIDNHEGNVEGFVITMAAPITEDNKYAYVYVNAPAGVTALYYQVNKMNDSEIAITALEGYKEADLHPDGNKYIIPLEIGTKGGVNIYYETSNFTSVPVAYSYTVTEKENTTSSVKIIGSSEEKAVFYNLQGIRINNPQKGIFIRIANGRKNKVIIP